MTHWDHLPNAKHIDWVLASLKANPKKWAAAYNAANNAAYNTASDTAYYLVKDAARTVAYDAAFDAAFDAAYDAARNAARSAARGAVLEAAWDAILALFAYDDCAYMIESEVGELKIIAAFGNQRAILLLPACIVYNEIKSATPSKSYMDKIKCLFSI